MTFKNPAFLLLFIPLVAVVFKTYQSLLWKKNFSPRLVVPSARLWLPEGVRSALNPRLMPVLAYAVAAAFFIIALARPQTSYQKIHRNVEGIDMMVVLDISASMRVEDFRDKNRMEVAKQTIKEFILGRQSDKIGFEAFSGEPVTLAPPTLDYPMIIEALQNIEMGDLKDGTAIGDALATAVNRLKESRAKSRVIVLLTDGDSNVGQVDPLTAGELAKGYGIKVYSIAIGKDGRQAIPFIQKDLFGRKVKTYQWFDSSINPELLKKVSAMTDGKFYRVQDDLQILRDVFKDIDQLEKNKIETTQQVKYDEKFMQFLWFGLGICVLAYLSQQTVFRVYP